MDEPSPFSLYFNTNYAPSETESAVLERLIQGREVELAVLGEKVEETQKALSEETEGFGTASPGSAQRIAKAKGVLTSLKAQRLTLEKFVAEHRRLLSPARRVPADVLSLIFVYCSPHDLQDRFSATLIHLCPSFIISHVCREWRDVALHTSQLWPTTIDATLPRLGQFDKLKASIERSSPRPLTMRIMTGNIWGAREKKRRRVKGVKLTYKAMVDMLCQSTSRWFDLDCTFMFSTDTAIQIELFDRPSSDYALLEKISFNRRAEEWAC
ncbi:hypothetical protein NMY22_g10293 [Coprinellus aureogranulatus]|nr:hypothetical protein NMY22_g10293 [Coprinellus aureogranulatus]